MSFVGAGTPITRFGLRGALTTLSIEEAALWAVIRVETSGSGFQRDRRPHILFERHWFHKFTGGRHDAAHPKISAPAAGGYGVFGAAQYDRLAEALTLDREAAFKSASWGLGQIMGFHARTIGYPSAEAMATAAVESEDVQLGQMVGFLQANPAIVAALRRHDWPGVARPYNGSNYASHMYDVKLKRAYEQRPLPDLEVRAIQLYLTYLGFDPGPIDGVMGNRTTRALAAWTADQRTPQDPLEAMARQVAELPR